MGLPLTSPWLLLLTLQAVHAKLQSGPLRIGGPKADNKWKYVSKFGYDVGRGEYQLRMKLQSPRMLSSEVLLDVQAYVDTEWNDVEAIEDPCDRPRRAAVAQQLTLNPTGDWGEWVNGSLSQLHRPHIWYFTVSDCKGALENYTHRLRFEFHATQDGGSEISIEMKWMLFANVVFLCVFTVFAWVFSKHARQFWKSSGSIHPVIWTLVVAMIIQYIAQICHTLHLWKYASDGKGIKALEVLSEIFYMLSQVCQTSLLILIALGYTLLQSRIGELDLMVPMCFMVGVIHIMLVGFGKIKDDASYKYHENEGVIGWILMVMRLLLYVWFLWAVQSSAAEGGMKLQSFLKQFRAAGSIYFLTYPAIFMLTKCFSPYHQHGVMAVGLMVMMMGSNLWLATLFLTRGEYFKVSTLSSSELPGGTKVGFVKEE